MTAMAQGGTVASPLPRLAATAKGIERYGAQVNTHDLMKVLAIVTMVIDHVGVFFMDDNIWMRLVGRMAAPLFFYLVGYSGSYKFKYQILALGVALWLVNFFASAHPSMLEHIIPVNILITFVLIKAIMNRFDPVKMSTPSLIILLAFLLLVAIPSSLVVEYGSFGLAIAIGARLINQRHPFGRPWIIIATLAHFLFQASGFLFARPDVPMHIIPFSVPLLVAIVLASILVFVRYRLRDFPLNAGWLRNTVVYISRYSLQVYFFHLAAFMIIYRLI
jgi:hypothetical protein